MSCNCGKAQAKINYVYVSPKGDKTTYTSEVQARAAQIRLGGGTYTAVPAR